MGQTEQDSGKTYADMWGEAVHSNRHLRVLSMGLAGLVLLLVVIIIRLSSVELPKPIVVRVDEVGRAEALAYETVEAQADPLDPTTKYFLNRWIDDYYSRRGATVETAWPRSLRFLTTTLANEAFRVEGENVAMLAAGAARDELQVERVTLRIQANPEPPHGAAADFDLVRLVNGAEVGRDRWTLSLQFTFVETVDPELMIVNPMGLLITYVRGDRALVTRMTTNPAPETPSPVTVPTLQDRARCLEPLGWSGREAEWIALVALHTGVFTRSQYGAYVHAGDNRKPAAALVRALLDKRLAIEDERAIFPGGARAVLLTGKAPYRALGIPDVRHRRGKDATTHVLMRRLLSLDYLIERPSLGWLPTEADKVQRFEALGIDRGTFPYRMYGPEGKPQIPRYFAFKLPIAVDEHMATFVYVDPGQTTDSELRAWGVAHAPLWAALRARTFAVHIVAVGTGVEAAERAAPVLKRWTQDGDGQGAADPAGPTKADPDIRQEIARLEHAITAGNRELLRAAGGWEKAADRLEWLQQLPEGTPTTATARGAIDRFTLWPTVRLTTPEVAI